MIDSKQEELMRRILTGSSPVLFLGAGFSMGAKSKGGMFDGTELQKHICEKLIKPVISNEDDYNQILAYDLRETCDQVYSLYNGKRELTDLLTNCYKEVTVSEDDYHMKITSYPWKEIYTVNIDCLLEYIYDSQGKSYFVQNKKGLDEMTSTDCTIIYKLHGCVNNPDAGYIFSQKEYTELISKRLDSKLNRLADTIINNNVIFVGTNLDEPDIQYYLQVYDDAKSKMRTNKLLFINPCPNMKLKRKIKDIGGELIAIDAKEFLSFVEKLNYNPDELKKREFSLNYTGVFRLSQIEKNCFVNPYESKLFTGEMCKWQDAADKWIVKTSSFNGAIDRLKTLLNSHHDVCCFCLYGSMFSGKSCLLKDIGYYLSTKDYEVLDFQGRSFDIKAIWRYIAATSSNKVALIIDRAAFYYQQIEKCFSNPIKGKEIIIITATRTYYHKKKKYFLEGNPLSSYEIRSDFTTDDAHSIVEKLTEKSFLSSFAKYSEYERIKQVIDCKNMVNLILKLTHGNISSRIDKAYREFIKTLSQKDKQLILELALFDILDIELYPRELFIERYAGSVVICDNVDNNKIDLSDLIRMDSNGVSIRNSLLSKIIIEEEKSEIVSLLKDLLRCISKRVDEGRNNSWYYIFQGLLAHKLLKSKLNISHKEIESIILSVKDEYKSISYYWLQLGLLYQLNRDYNMAFNYLEMSSNIRPESYQIQHAIARNHLRYANDVNDPIIAKEHFIIGERKMKELIESEKRYIYKAIPFSVTTYISEKIKFLKKYRIAPSNRDLRYMFDSLKKASNMNDEYMNTTMKNFIGYLNEIGKINILKLPINSPYLSFIANYNENDESFINDYYDDL